MFGTEVILTLAFTRVVLPVFVLLLIGEWSRRRDARYWSRS
jgi:hypothetical protein